MTTTILQFGATGQLAREMLLRSSGGVTIKALSRAEVEQTKPFRGIGRQRVTRPRVDGLGQP